MENDGFGGIQWQLFNRWVDVVGIESNGSRTIWHPPFEFGRLVCIKVWVNERGEFFESTVGESTSTIFQDRRAAFNWLSVELETQFLREETF